MLEALVLRILTRYLAPYVRGMSKDKLSVGVWSGNVELEGLTIKPEVTELLGLPFKLLWGQIGKVKLNIPWQRLGAIPVCLEVDGVYVLVEPKPIPAQSDADLTEQLRETKMRQVLLREQQLLEARLQRMQSETSATQGSSSSKEGDGGFFFRLSNKVISSIVVDIRNIHIALVDKQRGFKLGAVLSAVSVHNTDASWRKRDASAAMPPQMQTQSVFYKACEITGFAIYCALDGKDSLSSKDEVSSEKGSNVETKIQSPEGSASPVYADFVNPTLALSGSGESSPCSSKRSDSETISSRVRRRLSGPARGGSVSSDGRTEGSVFPQLDDSVSPTQQENWVPPHIRAVKHSPSHYVLRPLHLRLTLSHRAATQELSARLEVLRESQGVEIGRSQLKALLDVTGEASARQRRCEALLLREAHTVRLAEEDLEGVTQQEFLALYGQQLQASAGFKGVSPLSPSQQHRLQVLHDVVGVRYLAKWRSICAEATQRMLVQTQRLQMERSQLGQRKTQTVQGGQGWWSWITGRNAQQTAALSDGLERSEGGAGSPVLRQEAAGSEEEADAPLFTEADRRVIMAAVQNDEFLQSVGVPTKFSLDFELVRFTISLLDDTQELEEEAYQLACAHALEEARSIKHIGFNPEDPEASMPDDYPRAPPVPSPSQSAAQVESRLASAFLSLELRNLCAALTLTNRQDACGRDNSEWTFLTSLSSAALRQAGAPLMQFRCEADQHAASSEEDPTNKQATQLFQTFARVDERPPSALLKERLSLFGSTGPVGAAFSVPSPLNAFSAQSLLETSGSSFTSPAASLKLSHRLTPKGNILAVRLRLAPLVASIRPELVQTLSGFFVFETPEDVRRAGTFEAAEDGCAARTVAELERMSQTEFVEGLRERGGSVYSAAVQSLPALLEVDIVVAAPILWLDTKGAGQIALHLGTLAMRTDGPCPYTALRGVIELDQTRLLCYPCGLSEVSLLRPIPIRMQVEVLEMREFNVSLLLEEIFLELTPEALALLLAVPAAIAKSLLEVRSPARPPLHSFDTVPSTTHSRTDSSSNAAAFSPSRSLDRDGALLDVSSPRLNQNPQRRSSSSSATESPAMETGGARRVEEASRSVDFDAKASLVEAPVGEAAREEEEKEEKEKESLLCPTVVPGLEDAASDPSEVNGLSAFASLSTALVRCSCRFGRCGFMMRKPACLDRRGSESASAVLLAQVADLYVDLTADVAKRLLQVEAELDYVSVSDPSTQSPLFVSLRSEPSPLSVSSSPDAFPVAIASSPRGGSASSSASVGRAPSTVSGLEEEDAFEDVVELPEKSLRLSFKGLLGGASSEAGVEGSRSSKREPALLTATFLPVELHWRQNSLRQILETLEQYRAMVQEELDSDLAGLAESSEAFASASAPAARLLLSQQTFAAVKGTLASVQNTFSTYGQDAAQTVSAPSSEEATRKVGSDESDSLIASLADASRLAETEADASRWLREGLDLSSETPLPPLLSSLHAPVAPFLEVQLHVKGAAVAFWLENSVLARTGVHDLSARSLLYTNGDSDTELAVGGGAVMIEERCVLAPRKAEGTTTPSPPSSSSSSSSCSSSSSSPSSPRDAESALLSLHIRQYGVLDAQSGRRLPFSVCVTGRLHQVSLLYFQRDVSRVLDYLRDGIFDVVVSRSYEAVKQAATASYSLFALHVACPLFIVAEDKAVIPGYVKTRRRGMSTSSALHSPSSRGIASEATESYDPGSSDFNSSRSAATETASSSFATFGGAKDRTAAVASSAAREQVQLEGLGRYFLFDLGVLKVCNAFVESSQAEGKQDDGDEEESADKKAKKEEEEEEERGEKSDLLLSLHSQRDSTTDKLADGSSSSLALDFDLRVAMLGMRISASNNGAETDPRAGDFVEGCVLESVEGNISVRSSPSLLTVDVETSEWRLHLSRQQLTLLFDVLNENLAGEGYRPSPLMKTTSAASPSTRRATASSSSDGFASADSQSVRVSAKFRTPRLVLDASFGPEVPLAVLSVEGILVCASVNASPLHLSYRLTLCGESFTIEDVRISGSHFFRRVAEGTPVLTRGRSGDNAMDCFSSNSEAEEDRGQSDATASLARAPGLKFEMRSSPRESGMAFAFCDVTIYGLLVELMEILNYFSTAWGFSTMRTYPKPPPVSSGTLDSGGIATEEEQSLPPRKESTLASASSNFFTPQNSLAGNRSAGDDRANTKEETETTEETMQDDPPAERSESAGSLSPAALNEKPFTISVDVKNGSFLVYTDLRAATAPVILWRNDFLVRISMLGSETYFDAIRILNSRISRLETASAFADASAAAPSSSSSLRVGFPSGARRRERSDFFAVDAASLPLRPPAPVLDFNSAVLLCESLHAEGSGTYSSVETTDGDGCEAAAGESLAVKSELNSSSKQTPANNANSGVRTPAAVSEMQKALLSAPRVASAVRPSAATTALLTQVVDMAKASTSASSASSTNISSKTAKVATPSLPDEVSAGRSSTGFAAEAALDEGGDSSSPNEKRLVLSSLSLSFVVPAAKGLCSDGPSVSPPELPPQVRPPVSSDASSGEDLWRRRLCLPVEVRRTVSVHVALEGVSLLLLDDLRASVLPLFQMELSVGGINTEVTQKQLQVTVKNLASRLEYLNTKVGSWEPFVERLNVTAVYRRDFVEEAKQKRQRQLLLSGATDASPAEDPWRNFKAAQTYILSSYSPFWFNCTPQLCSLLAWFVPYMIDHLHRPPSESLPNSTAAILAEAPSAECPASSLAPEASLSLLAREDSTQGLEDEEKLPPIAGGGESTCNAAFRYLNLVGSSLYAFTLVKTREAGADSASKAEAAGTRGRGGKTEEIGGGGTNVSESGGDSGDVCHSTGQFALLQPCSCFPLSLDKLMQGRSAESSRRARPRQRLYIVEAPPLDAVLRIAEIFPSASIAAIARSLLATQDVDATAQAFLYREKVRQKMLRVPLEGEASTALPPFSSGGASTSFNPSPAEIGIFPRGMKAVAVNPLRRSCVALLPPIRNSLYSRSASPGVSAAHPGISPSRDRPWPAGIPTVSASASTAANALRGVGGDCAEGFLDSETVSSSSGSPRHVSTMVRPSLVRDSSAFALSATQSSSSSSTATRTLGSPSSGSCASRPSAPVAPPCPPRESSVFMLPSTSSYREFLQTEGVVNSPFVARASSVSGSFSAPASIRPSECASQIICDVLSPHPSFKLLVVSSTVKLENCSGLPVEVCFLDAGLSPILLKTAQACCAPLSVFGEQRRSAKLSFEDFCCRHPDLLAVPQWLREREERWRRQREAEAEEHRILLSLLRAEATAGANGIDAHGLATQLAEAKRTLAQRQSEREATDKQAYTFLLPDRHVMSVPPQAIIASGWINFVFRPAAFAQSPTSEELRGDEAVAPPDMSGLAGWVNVVDTRNRMEGLRWRQSSFLPPQDRPGAAHGVVSETVSGERNLFFLVNVEGRKSALPAEKEIKQVTIFPALTLVNATSTELDVLLTPRLTDQRPSRVGIPPTNSSPLQRLQALQQKPVLQATLRRHSTFFVYEVPPNRQLSMRLRFSLLDGAEWSDEMRDFLHGDDLSRREVAPLLLLRTKSCVALCCPLESTRRLNWKFCMTQQKSHPSFHSSLRNNSLLSFLRRECSSIGLDLALDLSLMPDVSQSSMVTACWAVLPCVSFSFFFPLSSLFASVALFVAGERRKNGSYFQTQEVSLVLTPRGSRGPPPVERKVDIPAMGGFSHATLTTPERCYTLCLKTEKILLWETAGAVSRVVSLLPEFILTNALKIPLFFRQYGTQGPTFEVLPGQSHPVYWVSADLPLAIQFRPGTSEGYAWSGAVVASEETAGKSWMSVYNGVRDASPGVFCVEVSPDRGVKSVCIRSAENGGGFLLINKCPVIQRVMVHTYHTEMNQQNVLSRQQESTAAKRPAMKLPDFDFHFFARDGETVAFGWQFPFTYASRPCHVLLWLDGKTVAPKRPIVLDMETPQYKRFEVSLGLKDMPQIVVRTEKRGDAMVIEVRPKPGTGPCIPERPLSLRPASCTDNSTNLVEEAALRSLHVALTMSQVGVSLVYDRVREELCFAELSQLAVGFQEKGERQKLLLRIADIQVDNQMENARKPVLLANRGGGASQAGTDEDGGSGNSGSKPFLHLYVVRHHTASSDLVLRRVQVEVDNLELDIDADMLNGLNDFLWACMESLGLSAASRRGVSDSEVSTWISSPLHFNYTPPALPTVLCLESVFIDRFDVYCWCSFVLDKMHMLSDLIKVGLRILMASGRLELMGAKLNFQCEEFRNLRGTAKTFVACLQDRYSYHILNSVLSSLGQTSLLNLPRLPYEFGKNTIGLAANAVDSVSAGLGSLLSTFTFDSEYINRRQRERVRSTHSMRDGFLSAGKNIGEGVWSLTNIVTKPIEGAQREGVGGFFKGIGKGIVGSLVKPLDKVGQAVSDVTRGIKAEVSRPVGASKAYDEAEATLRESLGLSVTRRLQKCISVLKQDGLPPRHLAVLFYPKDIFFVDLYGTYLGEQSRSTGSVGEAASGVCCPKPRVRILWHVCIPLIRDVRASTHGVLIRAATPTRSAPEEALAAASCQQNDAVTDTSSDNGKVRVGGGGRRCNSTALAPRNATSDGNSRLEQSYQIPCSSAESIMQIYRELLDAQQGSTAVVELGSWDSFRISQDGDEE